MAFWLGLGCDGFRVDMAASLVKEDPGHVWRSQIWRKVREFLDERFPEAVLVSEWGNPSEALNAGFDMDFLLHFGPSHYMDLFREHPFFAGDPQANIAAFARAYDQAYAGTHGKGYICIPSGNHDMIRMRDTLSEEQMKLAFLFLLTMPGCPFIYYGDEIGMRYVHGLVSKEGGYERTGSRTPMQWDGSTNAGFSAAPAEDLYLPLDPDASRPCVAAQRDDPESLYATVRALTALRRTLPALAADADFAFLHAKSHTYPLVYSRHRGDQTLIVAINPSEQDASCTLDITPSDAVFTLGTACTWQDGALTVPAASAAVLRV